MNTLQREKRGDQNEDTGEQKFDRKQFEMYKPKDLAGAAGGGGDYLDDFLLNDQ